MARGRQDLDRVEHRVVAGGAERTVARAAPRGKLRGEQHDRPDALLGEHTRTAEALPQGVGANQPGSGRREGSRDVEVPALAPTIQRHDAHGDAEAGNLVVARLDREARVDEHPLGERLRGLALSSRAPLEVLARARPGTVARLELLGHPQSRDLHVLAVGVTPGKASSPPRGGHCRRPRAQEGVEHEVSFIGVEIDQPER